MSRIPLSDELVDDGVDVTDPEFTQLEAEHNTEEYGELDFDLVREEAANDPIYIEEFDSDDE